MRRRAGGKPRRRFFRFRDWPLVHGQEFRDGDEFIALGQQRVEDLRHGIDGAGVDIVGEDDRAGAGAGDDALGDDG